jgi:hypothetical protein
VTAQRPTEMVARALLTAIWTVAGAASSMAQSYSINGQIGYLQEWEMKANLTKTIIAGDVSYDGPVTLRHVGLCSVNGPEEKSAMVRLTVSRRTSKVEGTLTMKDDSCRIAASASNTHSGLLNCREGQGVPISFTIDEAADGGQSSDVRAEK